MQLKTNVIAIIPDLVVFNELAPMGYYLGKKFVLVDIFDLVKESEFSENIVSKLNIVKINQNFTFKLKILILLEKILLRLSIKINQLNTFIHRIRTKEINEKFLEKVAPLNNKFLFDTLMIRAGNDLLIKSLVKNFKLKGFKGKVIGVSQSIPALSNIVHNKYYYDFPKSKDYFNREYSLVHDCDAIISNSKTYLEIYKKMKIPFLKKFKILPSLKNTYEWQTTLMRQFKSGKKRIYDRAKIKVLILHSNFFANINKDEIRRTVKILEFQKVFDVGIRPHIRFGRIKNQQEIDYIFKGIKKFKIFQKSLLESIAWSDLCIFYGSSAGIDALCQNKLTIFLRFATANTLDRSLSKYVTICDSPEDLVLECKKIIKFKKIKNYNKPFPMNHSNELKKRWINYLAR